MVLDPAPANPFRVVSSAIVYRNQWSSVVEDRLVDPAGRPGLYGYFAEKDAALICPLFPDRTVILVRQWRHAYGRSSWELPCGTLEAGESADAAAARELAEEAGFAAGRWRRLGALNASDSRICGLMHCYLAEDLTPVVAALDASEHDLIRERVPLAQAIAAIDDGRITQIATCYLLLRVERLLAVVR